MKRDVSTPPASREELFALITEIRRRLLRAVILLFICLGLILLVFFCLIPVFVRLGPPSPADRTWIAVSLPLATLAAVMLFAFGFDVWTKRVFDRLKCSQCGRSPTTAKERDFTLITARCIHCGGGYIRMDSDSSWNGSGEEQTVLLSDLAPQDRKVPSWKVFRPIVVWGIAGAITAGVGASIGMALANFLQLTEVREYRNLVVGIFAIPGIPVAGFGLIKAIREEEKLLPRCPECCRPFASPQVVRWTGCCDRCGRQIFKTESRNEIPTPEKGSRISLMQFLEIQRVIKLRQHFSAILGILALIGSSAITLLLITIWSRDPVKTWWVQKLGGIIAVAWLIYLVPIGIAEYRINGQFKCPACRKRLVPFRFSTIIATGGCPECGNEIIDRESRQTARLLTLPEETSTDS